MKNVYLFYSHQQTFSLNFTLVNKFFFALYINETITVINKLKFGFDKKIGTKLVFLKLFGLSLVNPQSSEIMRHLLHFFEGIAL